MKKITILAALAAATAFSAPSFADSTHCQPGSINCTIGDDNSTTTNVNPSTIVAPITNVSPVNTNAQQQGQLQGQAQGILNSGNSANNNRNDSSANVLASGNSSNDNRNTNVNGLIGSGDQERGIRGALSMAWYWWALIAFALFIAVLFWSCCVVAKRADEQGDRICEDMDEKARKLVAEAGLSGAEYKRYRDAVEAFRDY